MSPSLFPSLKKMFVTELKWLKFHQRGNALWLTIQGILSTGSRNGGIRTGCQPPSWHGALSQPRFSWVPWKDDPPFQDRRSGGCQRRAYGVDRSGWRAKMHSTHSIYKLLRSHNTQVLERDLLRPAANFVSATALPHLAGPSCKVQNAQWHR